MTTDRTTKTTTTGRALAALRGVLLAAGVLALAAPLALAQAGAPRPQDAHDGGPHGRWWKNPRVVERLGLTEGQVDAIGDIAFETGQQMIELRARTEKAQLALQRLLEVDDPDRSRIERAVAELEAARCEMGRLEVRSRTEIALLLDSEQRSALLERFEQFERMRRERAPLMERRRMPRDGAPGGRRR